MSVKYLENPVIAMILATEGKIYGKKEKTGLRLPRPEEIGKELTTYVKDGASYRVESVNIVTADTVIACNPTVLGKTPEGKDIVNQWCVPKETAVKNYGEEVVGNLKGYVTFHPKKAQINAIIITSEILEELGVPEGETLKIKVSWSDQPMEAKLGDFLTTGGYSISAHDMKDYEIINRHQNQQDHHQSLK